MKKLLSFLVVLSCVLGIKAADTVFIKNPQIPILIERHDNVLCYMRINAHEAKVLDNVSVTFGQDVPLEQIKSVKLYYGGTEAIQDGGKNRFAPVEYISAHAPGKTLSVNPSYAIKKSEIVPQKNSVLLTGNQNLYPGVNFFWVSIEMKPEASLLTKITAEVTGVTADGQSLPVKCVSAPNVIRRLGVGVRHAGDDGAAAFRIPGLVTTNKGTLLGVYDVRYNSSVDLQEHIDIGLSRSIDGGKTWEKMRLPLAFGEYGGLPAAQNGVGDPSILVDTKTNTIWIVAAWTHGMGNQRAWWSSQQGMDVNHTAQLVLVKSTDDGNGKTWSEPINITEQVKHPEWYFLLQGPGRGITMEDGTLVFPIQYIGKDRIPNAGIMYSKDRGETWTIHNHARTNTTEAQVAEVVPGTLMLNMRDNRGGSRAVYTTSDLGMTWKEHESSRTALPEPVCMASLISVKAADNILGKDILIFSNPNTTNARKNITIKISLDGGNTWAHQLLLDEGENWGYSCLTMVDKETIGILYESSVAHMTFQCIKLKDIVQ